MRTFLPIAVVFVLGSTAFAADLPDPGPDQIQHIISAFAAKEAAFAKARENYTYRQTAEVEELDDEGSPTGMWKEVTDIIFTPDGKRTERVVYAPVPTLHNILLDPGDIQDLRNVQPFVLTTSELPEYWIRYLGREKLDEITTFCFAVKPKKMEPGKRYFEGEVWVDDRDLQIVKTYGRGEGLLGRGADNQYPKFETYRQQIDGKYWFPTYTIANDTLNFKNLSQRIRMVVKYQDYKQFKSSTTITYGETVKDQKPPDTPPTKKQ
jgi:hypothetical protein